MEAIHSVQKKVLAGISISIILFVLSIEFAELLNFIYLVPFSIGFFLFETSLETELHQISFFHVIPFIFGLIADFMILKTNFILCVLFPLFSIFVKFLVKDMKISKKNIFLTINGAYAVVAYILNTPIWACIFAFALGFLAWIVSAFLLSKVFLTKINAET